MTTDVLQDLKTLWQTAFHEPMEAINGFFANGFSPDRCRYLTENGRPVSALYWFDCEYDGGKLAYIYAVATDPEHRGKGLASKLMQDTHAYLKALGYAGAVLKPASGLFPFYERLGYVTSGYIRRFVAEANDIPLPLKELSAEEYGLLRRSYLPQNGIRQEGVTLTFLHTFAKFYAAGNSIFCLAKDEPVFFEYLGNPNTAPNILAALGIKTSEIPTIGDEIPFAMFHPLNCTKIPGYLGISLE